MTKTTSDVVVGASGGIGNAVVRELAARGAHVRALNRSGRADVPAGVEVLAVDALDGAALTAACQGAGVIYHCGNVPYPEWGRTLPPMMENVIAAAAAAGAKVVYADNLYAYGKPRGPLTEDTPYEAAGPKGKLRAALAKTLLDAHATGRVRAVIGRASDFYGIHANALAGDMVLLPILQGKKAMWAGSLDAPHSLSYLPDFARGLITLGEQDQALGQIWHVPTAEPLTGRAFLTMAAEAARVKPNYGVYSPFVMRLVSIFSPMVREVLEELYQFTDPFIMDTSKFSRAFGSHPTPHRAALQETITWYRDHGLSQ